LAEDGHVEAGAPATVHCLDARGAGDVEFGCRGVCDVDCCDGVDAIVAYLGRSRLVYKEGTFCCGVLFVCVYGRGEYEGGRGKREKEREERVPPGKKKLTTSCAQAVLASSRVNVAID